MSKVSVIIPTFQRPQYICEAIDSIVNQTMNDINIIVVDDNGVGTDTQQQNKNHLQKYIENGIIQYIAHDYNKNGAVARNTGIDNSDSEYIAFLDDDDLFMPDKLKYQIKSLEENGSDICLCGFTRIFPDKEETTIPKARDITIPNILMHHVDTCAGSCLLVRNSLIKEINGFDESFERQQDLEFLIRLLKKGKLSVVDDSLVQIRMHTQNLKTPNLEKTIRQRMHFLEAFKEDISMYPKVLADEIYDIQYIEIIKVAIKNHKWFTALKWIVKTNHPFRTTKAIVSSTKQFIDRRWA